MKGPVVFCQPDGEANGVPQWKFWCEHCGKWHRHGGMEGHRGAHCMDPASPYTKAGGYYLKLDPRFDTERLGRIEDALAQLLGAAVRHDMEGSVPPAQIKAMSIDEFMASTETDSLLDDPIGQSLRLGIRKLGQALYEATLSTSAMKQTAEKLASHDRDNWGRRIGILDKQWDGIGQGDDKWWA